MADQSDFINVKDLIAQFSFEEHARLADEYFAAVTLEDGRLRKPFWSVPTTEDLLPKLGRTIAAAQLFPGARVCDFGAGTGWLTRALCEMGCEATALDISARALELGRGHMQRVSPEAFGRAAFVAYDGRRIPAQDGHFDRLIAFDSFHHVPNQAEVLAEMHRVLGEHGVAVFNEPGPRHSLTPASQGEMRKYNVIENDIVIEEIWAEAERIGFRRIELDMYAPVPLKLGLADFAKFASWEAAEPLLRAHFEQYRGVCQDARLFTLYKSATAAFDSRHRASLAGRIEARFAEEGGQPRLHVEVTNTGHAVWRPAGGGLGRVNLGIAACLKDGGFVRELLRVTISEQPTQPGQTRVLPAIALPRLPEIAAIELDLVAEMVAWFDDVAPTRVRLDVPG